MMINLLLMIRVFYPIVETLMKQNYPSDVSTFLVTVVAAVSIAVSFVYFPHKFLKRLEIKFTRENQLLVIYISLLACLIIYITILFLFLVYLI